jgi:hypothetical protein
MKLITLIVLVLSIHSHAQLRVSDLISDQPESFYQKLERHANKSNTSLESILDSELFFDGQKIEITTNNISALNFYVGLSLGAIYHSNINTGLDYHHDGKKSLNLELAVKSFDNFCNFNIDQVELSLNKYFGKDRRFSGGVQVNKVNFSNSPGFGPVVGYERDLFKDKLSLKTKLGLDYHYSDGGISCTPGLVSDFIVEIGLKVNLSNLFKRKRKKKE